MSGGSTAPDRHPEVVERRLGDELLIGRDLTGRTVVLDPVAAVLWSSLDGTVTVDELVEDVVASLGGTHEQRVGEVTALVDALSSMGFLAGPLPPGVVPRRLYPTPDPGSCLGTRMGLGRLELFEVRTDRSAFQFGATVPEVGEALRDAFGATSPGDEPVETFVARLAPARGRVARTQQLFDSLGNVLYAGRDAARGAEALGRTLAARVELDRGGAWSEGPALMGDGGVVLLHPAIGHEAVGPLRRELAERGLGFVPSAFVRVLSSDHVGVPADVATGAPALDAPLAAVVVPQDPGARSLERLVLASARRWDDTHLDAFLGLVHDGRVVEIPQGLTVVQIADALAGLASGGADDPVVA